MAITKIKLRQVESSVSAPGSIIATDSSNVPAYVSPASSGSVSHLWGFETGGSGTLPILVGTNLSYDTSTNTLNASAGAGGYSEVQEEGSALTARAKLNFIGTGFTATDDSGNSRTNLTLATFLNTLATQGNVNAATQLTGITPNANGGTGFATYAVGDILYANTTSTLAKLADVATGSVLKSGGIGVAPSWGTLASTDLTNSANIALLNANQTFSGNNTFSNNITMNGTPSASTDVVTVGYVSNIVANGLKFHSVRAASTAALTITGRTPTTLTVGGTSFVQDGVTFANGEYYLLKDNATGASGGNYDNGAYVVSGVGSSIVLTRATYMDAANETDGQTFVIEDGSTNVGTIWLTISEVTTLGTDAIVFTQIQTTGTVTGTGVNNQIAVWSGTNSQDGNSTFTWDQTQMTVGTTTPATSARVTIQGTGTTNSTFGLVANNSSTAAIFKVADDGTTTIGTANTAIINGSSMTINNGSGYTIYASVGGLNLAANSSVVVQGGGTTSPVAGFISNDGRNSTSSNQLGAQFNPTWNPSGAGTSLFSGVLIAPTIAQTTHTGASISLEVAPTLTSVGSGGHTAVKITASGQRALWTTAGSVRFDLGSDADFDMWYRAATTGLMTRLANGTTGQVLTATTSGAPSWAAATGGTVTKVYVTGSTSSTFVLNTGTPVTDVDGTAVNFTVPATVDLVFVVRNGVMLSRSGTVSRDYTLSGQTLTLASALSTDENLMIYKLG